MFPPPVFINLTGNVGISSELNLPFLPETHGTHTYTQSCLLFLSMATVLIVVCGGQCCEMEIHSLFIVFWANQIKSNHFYCHITTAQVPWWVKFLRACSRQCKKTTTIYIWTVHIYRLYRRQCAKYTYIYSVHIVYYKDILSYQLHIIHRMYTSTLCTLSIHYVVYT